MQDDGANLKANSGDHGHHDPGSVASTKMRERASTRRLGRAWAAAAV